MAVTSGKQSQVSLNMGRILTEKGEEAVDWNVVFTVNWFFFFVGLFVIHPLIPYFLSPYVLFIPNAMDEALVELIGWDLVKPLLLFVFVMGGMVGLILVAYYHRLFSELCVHRICQLRTRQELAFHASWYVGPVPAAVYILLTNFSPLASYQWGRLVSFFVTLPPIGCMIVTAAGLLVVRYWTEKHEKMKIKHYWLVKEKTFVLELV